MSGRNEPRWSLLLWTHLDQLDGPDRVKTSGDWIIYVTQTLLPELAEYRRRQAANVLDRDGWDAQRLAETIGSRTVAITRLAKEGRRQRGPQPP